MAEQRGADSGPAIAMERDAGGWLGLCLSLCWILTACAAAPAQAVRETAAPETSRGELLYDTHCVGCHTSVAHRRENPSARSPAEVAEYVRRWSLRQKLEWDENDVEQVSDFLMRRYYRFPPSGS